MIAITDAVNVQLGGQSFFDEFFSERTWYEVFFSKENMVMLSVIYNYYLYHFILASLILLVAMIGAIILTLNIILNLKKQQYYKQNLKIHYNSLAMKGQDTKNIDLFDLEAGFKVTKTIPKKKWWEYFLKS